MKKFFKNFIMAWAIVMFIGVAVSGDFRKALGDLLAPALDPLLNVLPFHIVVMILAFFTGLYSTIIQKFTIDYERLKEIQQRVMSFQKEYMEAMKKNLKQKLKKLEEEQMEIQRLQGEMFSMQMTSMLFVIVVTLPIFMWMYHAASNDYTIVAPFAGKIHISQYYLIFPWWIWWYMFNSIIFGQVIRKALKVGL